MYESSEKVESQLKSYNQKPTRHLQKQAQQKFPLQKLGAFVFCMTLTFALPSHAEPRVRAYNEAFFQDESLVQANAHTVDSLAYGEALYLMHTEEDLRALVRLEQETLQGLINPKSQSPDALGLHARLLQASIATKQGLNTYAQNALSQASSGANQQSPSSSRGYDLDRLFLFQSELAYEQKNPEQLAASLQRITEPTQLQDPDSLFYLAVHSALQMDNIARANTALAAMELSPWRAISKVNIALWHYRQQNYSEGVKLLKDTLEEIDSSIQLTAEEYWYKRGRRHMAMLDTAAHENQQTELGHLSDRILTLIAFGHIKQITEKATSAEIALANEGHLNAAQQAIFEIPQTSLFATQGLELLAQSLHAELENIEKDSLFETPAKMAAKKEKQRATLQAILQKLATQEQPVLTRLRSKFKLLKIAADQSTPQRMARLETTIEQIQEDINSRDQILAQPLEHFENILAPFYQTSHLGQGFDISNIETKTLPTHHTQFIQWLSNPQTKEFLKTLRFFQAAVNFIEDWETTKHVLITQVQESKVYSGPELDAAFQAHDKLLQKQDRLQAELKSLSNETKLLRTKAEVDYQQQAELVLASLENTATATTAQQNWIKHHQDKINFQQGQIFWQQMMLIPARQQKAQLMLQQASALADQSSAKKEQLRRGPPPNKLNIQAINDLDRSINAMTDQVKQALTRNKILFLSSYKSEIQQEHQHLKAALLQLRLEQAALLQLAGDKSE